MPLVKRTMLAKVVLDFSTTYQFELVQNDIVCPSSRLDFMNEQKDNLFYLVARFLRSKHPAKTLSRINFSLIA